MVLPFQTQKSLSFEKSQPPSSNTPPALLTTAQNAKLANLIERFVRLAAVSPSAANAVLNIGDMVLRSFGA